MIKIKFCGLSCTYEIEVVNRLRPEYIGFIFVPTSKRYITRERAIRLKQMTSLDIQVVGVFVNEKPEIIAQFVNDGIIDIIQLHGNEDEKYINQMRQLTDKPIIKAFRIKTMRDVIEAEQSSADFILLDSGAGTGKTFDWTLIHNIQRPYFLAGGLSIYNLKDALKELKPYAIDVSSGIETQGRKDNEKMSTFISVLRA